MLARWEVGVCAVLALCSVGIAQNTGPNLDIPPIVAPPPLPPVQAPDCGAPSHRPVALSTYASSQMTESWALQNQFSLELNDYTKSVNGVLSRDNHSVYMDFPNLDPADAPHIEWKMDGTVIGRMNLTRLSFHWLSEQTIDGETAYLGLHMEHKDEQGMTWILTYRYDFCRNPNKNFDVISAYASNTSSTGKKVLVRGFVPQTLMPYGPSDNPLIVCDYFIYEFSESPSMQQCLPSVFWIVHKYTQCIGVRQMKVEVPEEQLPTVEGVAATYLSCF